MKVKDLIKELSKLNGDLDVRCGNYPISVIEHIIYTYKSDFEERIRPNVDEYVNLTD